MAANELPKCLFAIFKKIKQLAPFAVRLSLFLLVKYLINSDLTKFSPTNHVYPLLDQHGCHLASF